MELSYEIPSVWISSINHIEKLRKIHKKNSFWRRSVLQRYRIPEEFPYSRYLFHNFSIWITKLPLIFFSNCHVTFNENSIYFESKDLDFPFSKVYNLMSNLSGKINLDTIKELSRYEMKEIPRGFFNIDWIHIITNDPLFNGDFLISIGKHNALRKRRRIRNNELYTVLKNIVK
ncbi:MAG: hypothetical protein ACW967_01030 [Candidatus Hodarchaeales archaeon]|jgi:hypothetical protein